MARCGEQSGGCDVLRQLRSPASAKAWDYGGEIHFPSTPKELLGMAGQGEFSAERFFIYYSLFSVFFFFYREAGTIISGGARGSGWGSVSARLALLLRLPP